MKGRKTSLYIVVLVITALIASSGINIGIMAASTENVHEIMVILSNETARSSNLL